MDVAMLMERYKSSTAFSTCVRRVIAKEERGWKYNKRRFLCSAFVCFQCIQHDAELSHYRYEKHQWQFIILVNYICVTETGDNRGKIKFHTYSIDPLPMRDVAVISNL